MRNLYRWILSIFWPVVELPVALSVKHEAAIFAVEQEIYKATAKWPTPANSAHEAFAVLHEEFDELKEHVWTNQKRRDLAAMRKEAVQVAAMAIRFAAEVCDEETGRR